jgi:RNA polymerase sigma-70 factor (ECF subfamily)
MPNSDAMTQRKLHTTIEASATAVIEALMQTHYAYIRRLAVSILNDEAEADDAAQETFIAASRSLDSFRHQASPRTWLTSIAVNQCRGRLRKRKVRQGLLNTLYNLHLLHPPAESLESQAEQNEADHRLWRAIDELDEKHRLPVVLRYVHELSAAEIAGLLDLNEGTVHSRLHYARKKLQTALGAPEPDEEVRHAD